MVTKQFVLHVGENTLSDELRLEIGLSIEVLGLDEAGSFGIRGSEGEHICWDHLVLSDFNDRSDSKFLTVNINELACTTKTQSG